MQIKKEHIVIGGVALVAVAATILLTSIFGGSKKPDEKLYDQLMQQYQSQIDDLKGRVESEILLRQEQRQQYDEYMRNDSVLLTMFLNNQPKYIPINKGYAEIPNRIKSIANDDAAILRGFTEY